MPDTYGTRDPSWYAKCAPDYLDTEEDERERDLRDQERDDLELMRRQERK